MGALTHTRAEHSFVVTENSLLTHNCADFNENAQLANANFSDIVPSEDANEPNTFILYATAIQAVDQKGMNKYYTLFVMLKMGLHHYVCTH